jgi:hypothetical protein
MPAPECTARTMRGSIRGCLWDLLSGRVCGSNGDGGGVANAFAFCFAYTRRHPGTLAWIQDLQESGAGSSIFSG